MRYAWMILTAVLLLFPAILRAEYVKCFNEGPYLRVVGGIISSTFDNNARTGGKVANDYEGVYGFQFGWNLWDTTAPELEVRYATKKVRDNREHIVNVNFNIKYSFVTNALTSLKGNSFHILPFVSGGPAMLIAAVPGDSAGSDRVLSVYGGGFGGGAGLDFLVKKYIYFGAQIQGDVYYIPPVRQNINGESHVIISGGWEPMLGVLGTAGVHF